MNVSAYILRRRPGKRQEQLGNKSRVSKRSIPGRFSIEDTRRQAGDRAQTNVGATRGARATERARTRSGEREKLDALATPLKVFFYVCMESRGWVQLYRGIGSNCVVRLRWTLEVTNRVDRHYGFT